jgi:hypothetical protein
VGEGEGLPVVAGRGTSPTTQMSTHSEYASLDRLTVNFIGEKSQYSVR